MLPAPGSKAEALRWYRQAKGILGVSLFLWYYPLVARPLRLEVVGGLYHVIVRGNERRNVFRDDADRLRYLARLAVYREKFGQSWGQVT